MADGIIYKALSGFYYVKSVGETVRCTARGRFRLDKNIPLVGDNVRFEHVENGNGFLTEILPRKNSFLRPPLANIDKMVIVASATLPKADPFLVDKMTVIAIGAQCEPVICINKLDLDSADDLYEIYKGIGITVLRTSAVTGEGISNLIDVIQGSSCAFCGNSGVGKSSILNAIDPSFHIITGRVSRKLGRGCHTTRHIELFDLSSGAIVADTPGFSAFDTGYVAEKRDIQLLFPEFLNLVGTCRFDDCGHIDEPDCAILDALHRGRLQKTRHDSYKRLYEQAGRYKKWEQKST